MPVSTTIKLINSGKGGEIKLDFNTLRKAVIVLRSVNHKFRQQIIRMLEESPKLTVTEIYVRMRLEQSVASQHLAILKKSGVVITHRSGKFIYYSLNGERIKEIAGMVSEITG